MRKEMASSWVWVWMVFLVLSFRPAWADVLKVPDNYPSIQRGIEAAIERGRQNLKSRWVSGEGVDYLEVGGLYRRFKAGRFQENSSADGNGGAERAENSWE